MIRADCCVAEMAGHGLGSRSQHKRYGILRFK